MSAQRIIVVLGPHRSGSSLLANALTCIGGARLPDGANWTAPDNPRGFAEPPEMIAFNDQILSVFGRTWSDPRALPDGFERSGDLEGSICSAAVRLLRSLTAGHPLTIIKEPRFCRLLPFWRHAFDACGYEVMAVRALRHPMESAVSLAKRNGLSVERGLQLWLEHVRCCRQHIPPEWRQASVLFDRLVSLPRYAVERVADELRLPVDTAALSGFCRDFLAPDLRHVVAEDADDESLPAEVKVVWEMERNRAARGGDDA